MYQVSQYVVHILPILGFWTQYMTRSQYMYAWSDYKKAWQQKLNLYLRISVMPSFVFLCVSVPALTLTLTLTLPLILNILSFVFMVCWCPRPHLHPAPHTQYSIFCFFGVLVSPLSPLTLVQIEPILGFWRSTGLDRRVLLGLYEKKRVQTVLVFAHLWAFVVE
jgi:hypothetical protein